MGKFALGVTGLLVLFSTVTKSEAKPRLALHLPSQVKKTNVKTIKAKTAKAKTAKLTKKNRIKEDVQSRATQQAMDDVRNSGLSQFDDKFVSTTAHFAASTAPVGEEYNCDGAAEEQQMRQAEREAMAKCEGRGEENCRLHQIKIVKKGELRCQDIPGRDCSQKKFYRGCVAQAIVVAGDDPEATASVF